MFGMIMAYDRKKLLSFYIEVVREDFTVERNYFRSKLASEVTTAPWSCMVWCCINLNHQARVQNLVAADSKANYALTQKKGRKKEHHPSLSLL